MTSETLIIVVLALSAGSLAKGATGFGLPVVAMPIMAAFMDVDKAVVIMTLPGVASNLWLLKAHWHERTHVPGLASFVALGPIGVIVGTWLLVSVSRSALSLVLAGWIIVYLLNLWANPHFRMSATVSRAVAPLIGFVAGLFQGTTGVSGPLVVTYAHALGLKKEPYVFTIVALFSIFTVIQLVVVEAYGLFTVERLVAGLAATAITLLVLPLGMRLGRRLDMRAFNRLIVGLLLLVAIKLLINGLI